MYKIIADSSCDITPDVQERLGIDLVPLTLNLGDDSYQDDENLDLPNFLDKMKACAQRIGTAAPSPEFFKNAFVSGVKSFVITLSSKLSGTYSSAFLAKNMAEEEGNPDVHVLDSKSASAAEILIALKLKDLIDKNMVMSAIIENIEKFIDNMKTYFVLESLDNLIKNGRINTIVAKIISALNIKPIMKADDKGEIAFHTPARNPEQIIKKMADTIEKSGKTTEGERIVITHCNNPGMAERLMNAIKERYNFDEILIFPMKGLSALYANIGGLIMAF